MTNQEEQADNDELVVTNNQSPSAGELFNILQSYANSAHP